MKQKIQAGNLICIYIFPVGLKRYKRQQITPAAWYVAWEFERCDDLQDICARKSIDYHKQQCRPH